jgi:hypothetical protein
MAKTKLQEFVLSHAKDNRRRSSDEILIKINTMDEARQVIEMMNKIGMCCNYNAWIDPSSRSGLNGFRQHKADYLLIDIHDKSITYGGAKKAVDVTDEKLAYINAKDYTVKRERKKLTL